MQLLDPENMKKTLHSLKRRPVDEQFKERLFTNKSKATKSSGTTFQSTWRAWGGIAAALMLVSAITIGWFATQDSSTTETIVDATSPAINTTDNTRITQTTNNANYILTGKDQDEIIHIDNKPYIRRSYTVIKSREVTRNGQTIQILEPQTETYIAPVSTY